MKLIKQAIFLGLWGLVAASVGCDSGNAQKMQPQSQGQRGESCQARNDCRSGLACVNQLCVKDDFDISPTAKHCYRVECADTADCCGDKPTEAPAKCAERATTCSPTLPGCVQGSSCASAAECGPGTCSNSTYCDNTFIAGCTNDDDCLDTTDTCDVDNGICNFSLNACEADADCHDAGECLAFNGTCSCTNPAYDPLDPICSDPDCDDICILTCDNELCVPDTSCETDNDCLFQTPANICSDGRCVECEADSDCDEDNGESCVANACKKPCEQNEECPFFHTCESGECVETGCTSDRECVLAMARVGGAEDPRLAVCLPSTANPEIKTCKIPCENDTSCGALEVCQDGYCQYIGCESNDDCRYHLGLANQTPNSNQPYVARGECRELP